jgi:hypothetical protein
MYNEFLCAFQLKKIILTTYLYFNINTFRFFFEKNVWMKEGIFKNYILMFFLFF